MVLKDTNCRQYTPSRGSVTQHNSQEQVRKGSLPGSTHFERTLEHTRTCQLNHKSSVVSRRPTMAKVFGSKEKARGRHRQGLKRFALGFVEPATLPACRGGPSFEAAFVAGDRDRAEDRATFTIGVDAVSMFVQGGARQHHVSEEDGGVAARAFEWAWHYRSARRCVAPLSFWPREPMRDRPATTASAAAASDDAALGSGSSSKEPYWGVAFSVPRDLDEDVPGGVRPTTASQVFVWNFETNAVQRVDQHTETTPHKVPRTRGRHGAPGASAGSGAGAGASAIDPDRDSSDDGDSGDDGDVNPETQAYDVPKLLTMSHVLLVSNPRRPLLAAYNARFPGAGPAAVLIGNVTGSSHPLDGFPGAGDRGRGAAANAYAWSADPPLERGPHGVYAAAADADGAWSLRAWTREALVGATDNLARRVATGGLGDAGKPGAGSAVSAAAAASVAGVGIRGSSSSASADPPALPASATHAVQGPVGGIAVCPTFGHVYCGLRGGVAAFSHVPAHNALQPLFFLPTRSDYIISVSCCVSYVGAVSGTHFFWWPSSAGHPGNDMQRSVEHEMTLSWKPSKADGLETFIGGEECVKSKSFVTLVDPPPGAASAASPDERPEAYAVVFGAKGHGVRVMPLHEDEQFRGIGAGGMSACKNVSRRGTTGHVLVAYASGDVVAVDPSTGQEVRDRVPVPLVDLLPEALDFVLLTAQFCAFPTSEAFPWSDVADPLVVTLPVFQMDISWVVEIWMAQFFLCVL